MLCILNDKDKTNQTKKGQRMRRIDITYMSGYDDDAVDEDACFMARSKTGVIFNFV